MGVLTTRQVLTLTLGITLLSALSSYVISGGDLYSTLFTVPLVAAISFWSLRLSQRVAMRFARRHEPPGERGPTETPPSSERPEHAQRRRQRRRPRGRQTPSR